MVIGCPLTFITIKKTAGTNTFPLVFIHQVQLRALKLIFKKEAGFLLHYLFIGLESVQRINMQ